MMTSKAPKPRAFRIVLWLLAVALLGVGVWHRRGWLVQQAAIVRYRMVRSTAERLAGAPDRNTARVRLVMHGFGGLDVYGDANRALPPATRERVVLYGDSITEYWVSFAPQTFFPGKDYVGRGIHGQTTPEMLWRFQQDVLDLHPRTVVLLGGTNDIIFTRLAISEEDTERDLDKMATMARARGIEVVLCSLLPTAYAETAQQQRVMRGVMDVNAWLKRYAAAHGLRYVDYFSAMTGLGDALRPELRRDALHPNAAGYRVMERVLEQTLERG
jgi:lysophospholipase L1-like esterase